MSYDHLGSVRMITDQNGSVVSRHDYVPFGEEILSQAVRTGNNFGAASNVNQMFTGQERDNENTPPMDFFNARYFASVLGSFTTPDPENAGADIMNPQTWNAYSYVNGNPTALTHPEGLGFWSVLGDIFSLGLSFVFGNGGGPSLGGLDSPPWNEAPPITLPVPNPSVFVIQNFQPGSQGVVTTPVINDAISGLFQLGFDLAAGFGERQAKSGSPPKNGTFTRMPLPPSHLTCTSLGTLYVAPPSFSLKVIVKAGQASGRNLFALRGAVGQGGTFDFQRVTDSAGNVQFYRSYTPVSNFAVGAYEFGAGSPEDKETSFRTYTPHCSLPMLAIRSKSFIGI